MNYTPKTFCNLYLPHYFCYRPTVNYADSSGQKPRVVYQYPVYRRIDNQGDSTGNLPGVGEVSAFGSSQESSKDHKGAVYGPPHPPNATPSSSSLSLSSQGSVSSVEKQNGLYSSPYTSYNPPQTDTKIADNVALYPPLDTSYGVPASPPFDLKTSSKSANNVESTLGPPLAPQVVDAPPSDHVYDYMDHPPVYAADDDHGPHNVVDTAPKHAASFNDGPPNFPPKSIDDIYDPSEMSGGPIAGPTAPDDHMPSQSGSYGPPGLPQPAPHDDITADLYPPVDAYPQFHHDDHYPKFFYDSPHFHHHVYEEIPHTTTEAPRKKAHYSYYFLGKKLYFIPLYFSMYFVIYVGILILKALVRHKVHFKYDWLSSHARDAKEVTFDKMAEIDRIHRNVTNAIDKIADLYTKIAM